MFAAGFVVNIYINRDAVWKSRGSLWLPANVTDECGNGYGNEEEEEEKWEWEEIKERNDWGREGWDRRSQWLGLGNSSKPFFQFSFHHQVGPLQQQSSGTLLLFFLSFLYIYYMWQQISLSIHIYIYIYLHFSLYIQREREIWPFHQVLLQMVFWLLISFSKGKGLLLSSIVKKRKYFYR